MGAAQALPTFMGAQAQANYHQVKCCSSPMAMLLMDRDTRLPKSGATSVRSSGGAAHDTLDGYNTFADLNSWSAGADVYVHVDEKSTQVRMMLSQLRNVVAVTYDKPIIAKDHGNITEGTGMVKSVVQWWRLRAIFSVLQSLETHCKHEHRAVVRARADLRIGLPPETPSLAALFLGPLTRPGARDTIIMASDYAFAADRATMQRVAAFHHRIVTGEFYGAIERGGCHAVDYRLLVKSDWEQRGPCLLKYNWLNFPRAVFDSLRVKSCSAVTRNMTLLHEALRVALPSISPSTQQHDCYTCFPGPREFLEGEFLLGMESERTFLTYLLSSGIRIRRWPTRTKLGTLYDGCCCGGKGATFVPKLSHGLGRMLD